MMTLEHAPAVGLLMLFALGFYVGACYKIDR
jgi:hypothetical protein